MLQVDGRVAQWDSEFQSPSEHFSRLSLPFIRGMSVQAERERWIGVSEHLGGIPWIDAGGQHLRGGEVAERVQVHVGHLELDAERVDDRREGVRIHRPAAVRKGRDDEGVVYQLDIGRFGCLLTPGPPILEDGHAGPPATAMRRSRPVLVAFSPRSSPAR